MRKKRLMSSLAVAAGLGIGGLAGVVLGVPGVSAAQTTTTAPAAEDPGTATAPATPDAPADRPPHDDANCPNMGGESDGTGSSTSGSRPPPKRPASTAAPGEVSSPPACSRRDLAGRDRVGSQPHPVRPATHRQPIWSRATTRAPISRPMRDPCTWSLRQWMPPYSRDRPASSPMAVNRSASSGKRWARTTAAAAEYVEWPDT